MNNVSFSISNGIGTVEFFTEQSNSLPGEILAKLASTIEEAGADPKIKVIILKSGGDRAFCAGASFDELLAIQDAETGHKFFMGFANVINAMRRAPKFILGRVHGKTVGGGVGLAAACDYCFATVHSSIKLSELSIGIGPFVVGPVIERKMGVSALSQMAINATKFYSAEWADEKKLFADVFTDVKSMDKGINELATKLSNSNHEAMAEMKRIFWEGTENWDELLSERARKSGNLVTSDFTKIFIDNFNKG